MKFKVLALFSMLFLIGCVSTPKPTVLVVTPNVPIVAPKADPITPKIINWKVFSIALTPNSTPEVLYTLDQDNFAKLNENLVDIQAYIKQQKAIIDFFTQAAAVPMSNANTVKK